MKNNICCISIALKRFPYFSPWKMVLSWHSQMTTRLDWLGPILFEFFRQTAMKFLIQQELPFLRQLWISLRLGKSKEVFRKYWIKNIFLSHPLFLKNNLIKTFQSLFSEVELLKTLPININIKSERQLCWSTLVLRIFRKNIRLWFI